MERLKAGKLDVAEKGQPSFTFQYGEIKSIPLEFNTIQAREFTFQYGEIKSSISQASAFWLVLFTFQYGEIKSNLRCNCVAQ